MTIHMQAAATRPFRLAAWALAATLAACGGGSSTDTTDSTTPTTTVTAASIGTQPASGSNPIQLDGATVITVVKDSWGLTITSRLPSGSNAEFVLTGSYAGSVTVYSDNDFKLTLANAAITRPDGPVVNIPSKQRAFVALSGSNTLADSSTWSTRTLADGSTMDLKATLFSEGPLIFSGNGSLTIATAAGKGIKVEGKESSTRTPLGFIAINAGTLAITSHDKAITASWESAEDGETATLADDPDPRVTINGGTLTITTAGTPFEDRNTADGDDSLAPEGIESKSTLTINGGRIYARSSTNDAIDSNGTMTITGGIVVADGAAGAEGGLDCDQYTFSITGGVLVGIGGRNSSVTLAATTQNTMSLRNVAANLVVLRNAAGAAAFAFRVPESSQAMLLSSPLIATGSTYTVVTGGTLGPVDEDFHGLAIQPSTHSGGTAGSSFTVTRTVTAL